MTMLNFVNVIKEYKLPDFIPNDYLFETHKDKGEEKWEIYAWAVRDIMAKKSGRSKIEGSGLRKKIEYESLIGFGGKKYD
jgi:hypothetical protein